MTLGGRPAFAAEPAAPVDDFRPSANAESHVVTETSQVLPAWTPSASLVNSYAQVLTRRAPNDATKLQLDRRAMTHVLLAIGLFDWVQLDLALPIILYQQGLSPASVDAETGDPLRVSALGDLRLGLKGTIIPTPTRGFGLGLSFDATAPTGSELALATAGTGTYAPQILLEQRMVRGIEAAVNLGYMVRPDRNIAGVVMGDAVTYRGAVRVPFGAKRMASVGAEVDGAIGVVRGSSNPMVLRGAIRWRARSGMILGASVGGAAVTAFGVPDVQGILSVAYVPPHRVRAERPFDGSPRESAYAMTSRHAENEELAPKLAKSDRIDPRDPDGDRLLAALDHCPNVAEDFDGFEDHDGCPEFDNDRDAIPDEFDLCRSAPEIINGYADRDGCPDVVGEDGSGRSFARFDPALVLPEIVFEAGKSELGEAARANLGRLAEMMRLNPWLGRIWIGIRVHPSADAHADRQLAQARGDFLREFLVARGLDPWRVELTEPKAVRLDRPERSLLALEHDVSGLRPLAPAAGDMPSILVRQPPSDASATDVMAQGPPEDAPAK